MPFDAKRNLAIGTVVTAPTPPTSGTSITVGSGEGARFPAAPFNGTVWAADMPPDPTTAEVWRCTARTGDVLTLVRAQEGTTARAIVAGDLIAATITAKSLTDIESGVNFPLITTPGNVTGDTLHGSSGVSAGAWFRFGPSGTHIMTPGDGSIRFLNSTASDFGLMQFGGTTSAFPALKRSGAGLAVRAADDSGPADLTAGNLLFPAGDHAIRTTTTDGADTASVVLNSSSVPSAERGAWLRVAGNEAPGIGGVISIVAGNMPSGAIDFFTGPTLQRGRIHNSGGFSWGSTSDPGAGVILVGGAAGVTVKPSGEVVSITAGASGGVATYYTSNGTVYAGAITVWGGTTAYNTTSDARLKTPLTRHTDTEVLRNTVIHNFLWKSDGTAGRGVFAQEAALVAPFAVSVGTDAVDDQGRLTHPWGVDYSKYVPDLITGWQHHDTRIGALFADQMLTAERLNALEVYMLTHTHVAQPSLFQRVRDWMDRITAWVFPKESPCV